MNTTKVVIASMEGIDPTIKETCQNVIPWQIFQHIYLLKNIK